MTTINQIRAMVADPLTPEGTKIFEDHHYEQLIEIEPNTFRAAALACNSLAAYYANKVEMKAGPVALKNQQKFEHYIELGKKFTGRAESGGGAGSSSMAPIRSGDDQEFFPIP